MRNVLPVVVVVSLGSLAACSKPAASTADTATAASTTVSSTATASPDLTTNAGKIQNAMSAAPDSISSGATIMDWPATEGGKFVQLRAGKNGWVCYPATPAATTAVGEDPMCLDTEFQKWAGAWMTKKAPKLTAVGIAYMLKGDRGASVTDPFAKTAETAKNAADWVVAGPHIMVTTPNTASLNALPGAPTGGTPWVMWKGTPYAHIMVPVKG
ncbi:MAG TPA: hypothetical protein VHT23_09415 [Gemmatimonadaceae bacterium]|jgi:hypothetical protein|nr:hypothetical protein [Gemmatimonadaceae bacterium]